MGLPHSVGAHDTSSFDQYALTKENHPQQSCSAPVFGESGDMRERANVKSQTIPRAATLTSRVRLGKSVNDEHCRIPDGHTSTQLYLVAG